MFDKLVIYRRDLNLFPNYTIGDLTIEIPESTKTNNCFWFECKPVLGLIEIKNEKEKALKLSNLAPGTYSVEFVSNHVSKNLIWTNKVILFE